MAESICVGYARENMRTNSGLFYHLRGCPRKTKMRSGRLKC